MNNRESIFCFPVGDTLSVSMPVPIHTEEFCCFHTVQQYNLGVYPPIFACIFADVHLGLVRKIKVAQQIKLCEAKGMKR